MNSTGTICWPRPSSSETQGSALTSSEDFLEYPCMNHGARKRVVVGMSGGVDSSVAALCLKDDGFDVHGLFMHNWEDDEEGYCTSAEDFQDARQVADMIGIPLHRVDFTVEYRDRVFNYFLDEYAAGRTPNPDVLCNREIKFGEFVAYAKRLGARLIATGHYARLGRDETGVHLLKARDAVKDQTYFLHAVQSEALAMTMFPLGEQEKSGVREIARQHGMKVHAKKDSTGICFIGERPFRKFLSTYLPAQPGPVVTAEGDEIGEHTGLMYYTIGQRQGLGLGGRADAPDAPWYVAGKNLSRNTLVVVQGHENPALLSSELRATDLHWINAATVRLPMDCHARIRYRQQDQACHLEAASDGILVNFQQPQRAVTPGQFVVFYRDDECLGGAVIADVSRSEPPHTADAISQLNIVGE